MAIEDFEKKQSEPVNSDAWGGFLGIQCGARYYTKTGVISLYSEIYFLDEVNEGEIKEFPDYVLSDKLQKDLES